MSCWTAKAHELLQAQAKVIAEIIRDTDPEDPVLNERRYATTAGGDERKLRGIPVLARGSGSTIPGTDPLRALLAKERNVRRA